RIAGQQVRAVTTILELKGKTGPVLSQIFENLDGADFATLTKSLSDGPEDQFHFNSSEGLLAQNVQPGGAGTGIDVSFLFFRMFDAETEAQLRAVAGLPPTGNEILVVQENKATPQKYVNHFDPTTSGDIDSADKDPFASLL